MFHRILGSLQPSDQSCATVVDVRTILPFLRAYFGRNVLQIPDVNDEKNGRLTCAPIPAEAVDIQPVVWRLFAVILESFVLAFLHPEVCAFVPEADLANLGAEIWWLTWNQLFKSGHK